MAEEQGELLQILSNMLGDHPEEKISQALSLLGKAPEEPSATENLPDIGTITKIAGLLSGSQESDNRAALLSALKPFLSEERRPKVDSAIRLLKLAKMAETAGKSDLFKDLKL